MKRFSPAMVIASLALLAALTGTAVAGSTGLFDGAQLINHSVTASKLTPNAIAYLRGKRGKGDRGPAGPIGAAGPAGPSGPKGDSGPAGPAGVTGPTGATGPTGPTGPQGLRGYTGPSGARGVQGETGARGAQGLKGDTGATGAQGSKGDTGATGAQGVQGDKGDKGDQGAPGPAWTPDYGVAQVLVSRGGHAATPWATYSTTLGSPAGDTASGTFRFTCSVTNAPCTVALDGYTTSAGSVQMYPRILIYRTSTITEGAPVECEYADGTSNSGGMQALTTTPATTPLAIGSTVDCASGQTVGADTVNGGLLPVDSITVPEGYYDVFTTLTFVKS